MRKWDSMCGGRLGAWVMAAGLAGAALFGASDAQARNGGFYLQFAPGYGVLDAEEAIVEKDTNEGGRDHATADFVPQLKLGVSLFGYGGIETDIAAYGWDLTKSERGGGGFVGGTVRLQPLEIVGHFIDPSLQLPSISPPGPVGWDDRFFDLGVYVGGGFTMLGEDYAYQGSYIKYGFDLQFYITPNFAIGLDFPFRTASLEPFRYTNYAEGLGYCTDGATIRTGDGTGLVVPDSIGNNGPRVKDGEGCKGAAPMLSMFTPSLTISGIIDFGI